MDGFHSRFLAPKKNYYSAEKQSKMLFRVG